MKARFTLTWKNPDLLTQDMEQMVMMVRMTVRMIPDMYADPGINQPLAPCWVKRTWL